MKESTSGNHNQMQNMTRRMAFRKAVFPYVLISPTMLFLLFFLILPLGFAMYCSLFRVDYMQFTKFIGFGNFVTVLKDPEMLASIGRSFFISILSLAVAMFLGVVIALWIHRSKGLFAYVLQIITLIPWVTSMVVAALLWKWMFQSDLGLLNFALSKLGLGKIGFLTDPHIAIFTLIFVMTWRVVGYVMVQVLAGLKAIPFEYEEAAFVDGANKWELFWYVRLPLLKTPLAISAIIVGLSNINNLTVPLTLLAGGPGNSTMVIAIEAYRQSFAYYHFGEASALTVILCALNFLLTILYMRAVKYEI